MALGPRLWSAWRQEQQGQHQCWELDRCWTLADHSAGPAAKHTDIPAYDYDLLTCTYCSTFHNLTNVRLWLSALYRLLQNTQISQHMMTTCWRVPTVLRFTTWPMSDFGSALSTACCKTHRYPCVSYTDVHKPLRVLPVISLTILMCSRHNFFFF